MSVMDSEVYEASKAMGAPEVKASAAAQALSRRDPDMAILKTDVAPLKTDMAVLKWGIGVLIGGVVTLLPRAFYH